MSALALPEPEYRALPIFDRLPQGCFAWLCSDNSSHPHIRPGEWAVVDAGQRRPVVGELFVIKFGPHRRHERICLASLRPARCLNKEPGTKNWHVGSVRNAEIRTFMATLEGTRLSDIEKNCMLIEAHNAVGGWTEGPYETEGKSYDHLCDCLMGMVIGLYQGPPL